MSAEKPKRRRHRTRGTKENILPESKDEDFIVYETLYEQKKVQRPIRRPKKRLASTPESQIEAKTETAALVKNLDIGENNVDHEASVSMRKLVSPPKLQINALDEATALIKNIRIDENNVASASGESSKLKQRKRVRKPKAKPALDDSTSSIKSDTQNQALNNSTSSIKSDTRNQAPNNSTSPSKNTPFPRYLPTYLVGDLLSGKVTDGRTYVQGTLRINPKFYKHAYISVSNTEMDLLIVDLIHRNRALEGDVVVAVVRPEKDWVTHESGEVQKTGSVVHILKKVHSREIVGVLKITKPGTPTKENEKKPKDLKATPDKSGSPRVNSKKPSIMLVPRDSRLPLLKIPLRNAVPDIIEHPERYKNKLFLAELIEWNSVYSAIGQLIDILGEKGDLEVEKSAILADNSLDSTPYNDRLLSELRSDYTLLPEDLNGREDWRKSCIFTIDPATAVDLDDALSCRLLDNGNYEVGVHIADVTHFLRDSSALDKEVAKRATTIYLVDTVYHMLPKKLCQACSLLPGQDKLAFSVIWEMTPEADILTTRFAKTIINSCVQLSYQQAQKMIENEDPDFEVVGEGLKAKDICETVRHLHKLSSVMRKQRFDTGALRIEQPKLYIRLDAETRLPISYALDQRQESNDLVEEFMLLANGAVAERLYETTPKSLLRSHKEPSTRILTQTSNQLEKFGVLLNYASAGDLHNSMCQYLPGNGCEADEFAAECRMMVINNLCARSMTRALYMCANRKSSKEDLKHYALNVDFYTHFTSPIRRYADCVVHRQLYASIGGSQMPDDWDTYACKKVADTCNIKKYSAKCASEQSAELHFAYFLHLTNPVNTIGIVLEVRENSVDVVLRYIGLKVRIYLADLKKEADVTYSSEHDVPTVVIQWKEPDVTKVINMFSILEVHISKHPQEFRLHGSIIRPAVTQA